MLSGRRTIPQNWARKGTQQLSISVGGICAPLFGTIGDTYGLPAVMYTIAGVALMGLIASFWIKEPQKSTRGTYCYK